MRLSKWQLFDFFVRGIEVQIQGVQGFISAIEREDGSGSSFNVTLLNPFPSSTGWTKRTYHLRTVD